MVSSSAKQGASCSMCQWQDERAWAWAWGGQQEKKRTTWVEHGERNLISNSHHHQQQHCSIQRVNGSFLWTNSNWTGLVSTGGEKAMDCSMQQVACSAHWSEPLFSGPGLSWAELRLGLGLFSRSCVGIIVLQYYSITVWVSCWVVQYKGVQYFSI